MTEIVLRSAIQRREELQAEAAALGIDDAYVSCLVETFYQSVRANPSIGPIFEQQIGDDWSAHLSRMKDFWASVALHEGRYAGKPVPAHQKLHDVRPWHFDVWLELFEQTLRDTAPTPAAVDYFMERARRIATSLQLAMFAALPPVR